MKHQIVGKYQNEMPNVARKAFTLGEIWNPLCCHGNNTFERKELFILKFLFYILLVYVKKRLRQDKVQSFLINSSS